MELGGHNRTNRIQTKLVTAPKILCQPEFPPTARTHTFPKCYFSKEVFPE